MIETQVRNFILKNFLFTDDAGALANDQSLIEGGTLDSTGILELITFVEETFHIKVADEEMLPANFGSVTTIAAFVARKKQAA